MATLPASELVSSMNVSAAVTTASKIKWTSSKPGVLSANVKTRKVTAKKAGKK